MWLAIPALWARTKVAPSRRSKHIGDPKIDKYGGRIANLFAALRKAGIPGQ